MLKFKNALIALILCSTCTSLGHLNQRLSVDFFRAPESPFPSGEKNLFELEKNKIQTLQQTRLLLEKDGRVFWAEDKGLTTALDVVHQVRLKNENSKAIYNLLRIQSGWALLQNSSSLKLEWKSTADIMPVIEDLGAAFVLQSSPLRSLNHWKSDSILTVPAHSKLRLLRTAGTWAFVEYDLGSKVRGWLPLTSLLSKADFASFIRLKKQNQWQPVLQREGGFMVTATKELVPLEDIESYWLRNDLAIAKINSESPRLVVRSHYKIQKLDSDSWNLSQIKGHGEVFWKTPKPESKSEKNTITTQNLIRKNIFASSFFGDVPNYGLVSSNGVFLTEDGLNWRELPQFKNKNLPVLILKKNLLLVGDQVSVNNGKTFEPFLAWEQLSSLIPRSINQGKLTLQNWELSAKNRVLHLRLMSGNHKLHFVADEKNQFQNWRRL